MSLNPQIPRVGGCSPVISLCRLDAVKCTGCNCLRSEAHLRNKLGEVAITEAIGNEDNDVFNGLAGVLLLMELGSAIIPELAPRYLN